MVGRIISRSRIQFYKGLFLCKAITRQKSHSKFDFTSQDVIKSDCINLENKSNLLERAKSSGN